MFTTLFKSLLLSLLLFGYYAQAKSAVAIFNNGGISGSVTYTQDTADDPVQIDIQLTGLNSRAGGYHVHELPVNFGGSGFQFNSFDIGCGFDITADHFNPLNVQGGANNKEAGPYLCSPQSPADCESGDISGKFGLLTGLDTITDSFTDGDSGLTLFGRDSIIGRSMVIHRADGSRLVCANIFEENAQFSTAIATFDRENSGLEGTVTILSDAVTETQILFANLELAADFPGEEANLEWTIHSLPVLAVTNDNLFSRCSEESLGEGELDLGTLLDPLALKKGERTKILRTLTSSFIDLNSKSLSFASGRSIIDCVAFGKIAVTQFVAEEQNGVSGQILFRQTSENDPVAVSIEITGLDSRSQGYHVHTLPVFEDCASTTGHFNPLKVDGGDGEEGTYLCDKFNPELCEAGDLSNRFGDFLGRNTAGFTFVDSGAGLNLFGRDNIVGRSVVIHRIDGSRLACADISEFGRVIRAEAVFSEDFNDVSGKVSMLQRAVDPDAETSFVFDITRTDGDSTADHMFHIHESRVSESNNCAETNAHFSPSGVNGGAKQTGSYRCNEGAEFCEIGDISGKQGLAALPGRRVFTDFTVPLSGIFSVVDLSITFHDENVAPTRIDCANIQTATLEAPDIDVAEGGSSPVSGDSEEEDSDVILIVFLLFFAFIAAGFSVYVAMLKLQNIQTEEKLSRVTQEVEGNVVKTTL